MAQGLGLAGAYGAASVPETLDEMVQAQYRKQLDRQKQQQIEAEHELERSRDAQAGERIGIEREGLALQQARAEREAAKFDGDRDAARATGERLDALRQDPTIPAATRRLMEVQMLGGGANMDVHNFEDPAEHQAHAPRPPQTPDEAFADWKRRRDYDDQLQRGRRVVGVRQVQDDPTLPRGVQSYLVQLRSKYPTYDGAAAEFSRALGELSAAHPNLSPTKAMNALRQTFSGAGRSSDPVQSLVDEATQALGGAGRGGAGAPRVAREANLQQKAAEILRANGYDHSPAAVQKFMANPANMQRLMGGQ